MQFIRTHSLYTLGTHIFFASRMECDVMPKRIRFSLVEQTESDRPKENEAKFYCYAEEYMGPFL